MNSEKVKEIKNKLQQINERELSSLGMILQFEIDVNDILTLINELEKENAKYKQKLTTNQWVQEIRKEASIQFAEKLKEKCEWNRKQYCCSATVSVIDIDETLKEFIND